VALTVSTLRRGALTRGADRRNAVTAGFLIAASVLATVAPWHASLSPVRLLLVLVVWIGVEQVRTPDSDGWRNPAALAFVPALFLLPTPVVPLVAAAAVLLCDLLRLGAREAERDLTESLGERVWYTLVPALVIVIGGGQRFAWSHWPVYAAAVLAQVGAQTLVGFLRPAERRAEGGLAALALLSWSYLLDAALAPLGLLIASVAIEKPGLLLIALSPAVKVMVFGDEHQERLDESVALGTAYRGTAMLLADMVEADDAYTGLHSRDVVDLSLAIADQLGLDAAHRHNIEFAALLHDIGKVRVPKHIINKRDRLEDHEWAIVRRHTIEGERMLRQVGGALSDVGRFVRSSHERYDGLGYPDGLRGEEIPLESRIISACDAFSAMTTDRSYRTAMTVAEALGEIRAGAGSQFDPVVVEAIEVLVCEEVMGSDRRVPAAAREPAEPIYA
jgi:putative nucleotidyltransferase with HDIG domain